MQEINACTTLYLLLRIHISTNLIEFNIFDGKSIINTRKIWASEVGLECYSLSLANQFRNSIRTIWRTSGSDKHSVTLLLENSTDVCKWSKPQILCSSSKHLFCDIITLFLSPHTNSISSYKYPYQQQFCLWKYGNAWE